MGKNTSLISKVVRILQAFTDDKMEWGVNELARFLKTPVGSLHRHLTILKEENVLKISAETGKYIIGEEFIRMSAIVSARTRVNDIAKPFLRDLSKMINQSVYLAIYHHDIQKLSFVEKVLNDNELQYIFEMGDLKSVHIGASGKSIMAYLAKSERENIIKNNFLDCNEAKTLEEDLKSIKYQGYAITRNERKIGALSFGSPIFDVSQNAIGSLITIVPIVIFEKEQQNLIISSTQETARKISRALGYLPFE